MIDLQQYKVKRLERFNQIVVLDHKGFVLQSCNSIFDATEYTSKSILVAIPFLDSIFGVITELQLNTPEVLFSRVQSAFSQLNGVYDYTFLKKEVDGREVILWSIYDFTALYKDLINYQQRYNESTIRKELKESVLKSIIKYKEQNPDIQAMIAAVRNEEVAHEFEIKAAIQTVFNAFAHFQNSTFSISNLSNKQVLHGDETWFKFMLHNLLDNIIPAYKSVDIKLDITSNDTLDNTYLSLHFSFLGKINQPDFFKIVLEDIRKIQPDLSVVEQVFLSKLYSIQKIVHQYNGYLELKASDESFEEIQTNLVFSFHFKNSDSEGVAVK